MPERAREERMVAIYRETIEPLYGFVARRCSGDRSLAEDVTQETWLRAISAWRDTIPDNPLGWLITVARNLLANYYRRRRPLSLENVDRDRLLAVVDDGFESDSDEIASLVHQGLSHLPRRQARLLEAFHLEKLSVKNIAEAEGLTERAVEGRLRRGRLKLRHQIATMLEEYGGS